MICFTDNDILHKLATFDLWEEARTVLSVSPEEVLLLPTAPFVLGLKDPAKAVTRHGTVVASRLQAMVATSGTVEESPAVEDQVALAGVLGSDQGEAILIALASRSPPSLLLTGDKRSLHALGTEPACAAIVERLTGRVVVLEQVVRAIVTSFPFEIIRVKVVPAVAVTPPFALCGAPGRSRSVRTYSPGSTRTSGIFAVRREDCCGRSWPGELRVYHDVSESPRIVTIRAVGIKDRNRVSIGKRQVSDEDV